MVIFGLISGLGVLNSLAYWKFVKFDAVNKFIGEIFDSDLVFNIQFQIVIFVYFTL